MVVDWNCIRDIDFHIYWKQIRKYKLKGLYLQTFIVPVTQEMIKAREWIPHVDLRPKVIPLKLFLEIVSNSSMDTTHALWRCLNGGYVYVLLKENLQRCGLGMAFNFEIFKSKETKKQGSFGSCYVLIHCATLYHKKFNSSLNKRHCYIASVFHATAHLFIG